MFFFYSLFPLCVLWKCIWFSSLLPYSCALHYHPIGFDGFNYQMWFSIIVVVVILMIFRTWYWTVCYCRMIIMYGWCYLVATVDIYHCNMFVCAYVCMLIKSFWHEFIIFLFIIFFFFALALHRFIHMNLIWAHCNWTKIVVQWFSGGCRCFMNLIKMDSVSSHKWFKSVITRETLKFLWKKKKTTTPKTTRMNRLFH